MLILLAEVQINFHISLYIQISFFQVYIPLDALTARTDTGELHFTQGSAFKWKPINVKKASPAKTLASIQYSLYNQDTLSQYTC